MFSNEPPYIQFYPTLQCNYTCHFCFNKGVSDYKNVKIADFNLISDILKKQGIEYIDILGGEPTLHLQLIQLLEIITAHQLKTTISTNGTNLSLLKAISDKFLSSSIMIGISLNSTAISEELDEYIKHYRPLLKTVFTDIKLFHTLCEKYIHMPGIEYYLLYRDIVSKEEFTERIPFYQFYTELFKLKKTYKRLDGVFCSGFLANEEKDANLHNVRCPAGTTKLSMLPDGSVYPCYLFFRHKEFKLGSILTMDFESIWKNPLLNYFRTFEKNNCPYTECKLFHSCHGGCPALSYIFYNSLTSPDPRCVKKITVNL